MKVRVKEGMNCFVGGSLRTSGVEFTIYPVECSVEKDSKGKLRIISEKEQFNDDCMELLENPKAKPGPKPKVVKEIKDIGDSKE